jgi:hypothetical protein
MTPAWILDIFAALMLVVAAVSAARLVAARPWQRGCVVTDTDITHLLMGIAMAGMLASSLTTLPNGAWEVVFGLMTAWFAYRVVRDARANGARALAGGHCAPHLVHSAAMLYMFLALTAPAASGGSGMSGMGGMGGSSSGSAMQTLSYPTLAFVFALILVSYTIWDLDQISGRRYAFSPSPLTSAALAGAAVMADVSAGATLSGTPADGTDGAASAASCSPATAGQADAREFLLSPGVTVGCRIAMGVTMALMLLLMI